MRKSFFILVFFLLASPLSVFAQADVISAAGADTLDASGADVIPASGVQQNAPSFSGSGQLKDPLNNISTIPDFFRAIIDILLVFAIPFVVFFIVWAGFLYVTARGNPEKIKQAHSALIYALIGGLLILGANLLLDVITNTVDQVRN